MNFVNQVEQVLVHLDGGTHLLTDLQEREPRAAASAGLEGQMWLRRYDLRAPRFDYQQELVDSMLVRLDRRESGLLSLPTGAGKTRTAALAVLESLLAKPEIKWVWLAPSLELLDQAVMALRTLWQATPNAQDLLLAVRTDEPDDASVWFTTPQAVYRKSGRYGPTDAVIFDEAHQLGAPTFRLAVERVRASETSVFGLSATPGRADVSGTRELVDYFGGQLLVSRALGRDPVAALQGRGVLSHLSFRIVGKDGESRAVQLDQARVHTRRLGKLVEHLAAQGRRTLVFTRTVAEAVGISLHLRDQGLPVDYVDGTLEEGERRARVSDFASGKTLVLLNQKLLATGYDCPAVTDVVLGTRINSPILFEQMVGRAARGPLTGGSRLARVWQFEDHLALHGLPQSYYRYRDYEWEVG